MKTAQLQSTEPASYTTTNPGTLTDAERETVARALAILDRAQRHTPYLTSSDVTRDYLRLIAHGLDVEHFWIVHLTNQHQVIEVEQHTTGTIDAAAIYPREVMKSVLTRGSASVVLAHNHPSGEPEPSYADRQITKKLKDALELVSVRVLDHIIVGSAGTVSMAERGML
jgi:DNA repair protein RadC